MSPCENDLFPVQVETMHSEEDKKALIERQRASYRPRTAPKRHHKQQNSRHAYPTTHSWKCYQECKELSETRGLVLVEKGVGGTKGYCRRAKMTYLE